MMTNLVIREREMPSSADSAPSASYAVESRKMSQLEPAASAAASERAALPRRAVRPALGSAPPPSDAPPSDVAPALTNKDHR